MENVRILNPTWIRFQNNMRLVGLVFLIHLPMIVSGQTNTSDTLTLNGIIFIGDFRRQIDSIELIQDNGRITSFSTDRLGKFEVKNLSKDSYRLHIKEFNYDTAFSLKDDVQKELWIFIPVACEVSEEIANLEIQQGQPRLLLIGSIAPVHVVGQEKFEKQFKVKYYDFGCTPPHNECVIAYNKVIFNYLDKTYGTKWRKKVRTDVIGYK